VIPQVSDGAWKSISKLPQLSHVLTNSIHWPNIPLSVASPTITGNVAAQGHIDSAKAAGVCAFLDNHGSEGGMK
jgi:hypothetical protein